MHTSYTLLEKIYTLLTYYWMFCDSLDTILYNFILKFGLSSGILESEAPITDLYAEHKDE